MLVTAGGHSNYLSTTVFSTCDSLFIEVIGFLEGLMSHQILDFLSVYVTNYYCT